jgi:hypothetical protein
MPSASARDHDLRLLRVGIASIWLTTALAVAHPHYREIGHHYLADLGLPDACMYAACAFELALGVAVLVLPVLGWLELLQGVMVVGFTITLAALEPMLLVHPFGVLSKNYPLLCMLGTCWLVSTEGWSHRAAWLLRAGMALVWVTEGIFPKLLFQQPFEVAIVANSGLAPLPAPMFLALLGVAQALSGALALLLRGRLLTVVLAAQLFALVALPLLVSWQDPLLWVHPFGPMTKNLPLIAGTLVVLRRRNS